MTPDVAAFLTGGWFISRLIVDRVRQQDGLRLTLELVDQRDQGRTVAVIFSGVTQLTFEQLTSNLGITPQVVSIEDRGWERADFKFTDVGSGSLGFLFTEAELGPSSTDKR